MPPNSRLSNVPLDDEFHHHTTVPVVNESTKFNSVTTANGSTETSPKAGETFLEKVFGTLPAKGLFALIFGYYMFYQGNSMNYTLFLRNFVWVLALIVSACQDEVHYSFSKLWRKERPESTHISAATRPCTIEYNLQIQIVIGIITYSLTGLVFVLFDSYNRPNGLSYVSQAVAAIGSNLKTIGFDTSVVVDSILNTPVVQTMKDTVVEYGSYWVQKFDFGETSKYNEILYQVVALLASYHIFERSWWVIFCYPLERIHRDNHGLRYIESKLVFPTLVIAMFLLQDPLSLITKYNLDPAFFNDTVRSILYGWIVFKVIDFTIQYRSNQNTLQSYTYPGIIDNTPIAKKRQAAENHFTDYSMAVGSDRTPNTVWNIYGNQYDVTAFVPHHPGGVESIMLAANREDATALFQSYHPFNMKKARAVLEKYRLSSSEGKPDESIVKVEGFEPQYGHVNDPFYDVLCQRITKCLEGYNIHPVYNRDATWNRLGLYFLTIAFTITMFYKHCQGSIWCSMWFAFAGDICAAHIGHDGGHFAISRRFPRVNDVGVWAFFLISNPITWQHQHTYAHHSYTNDEHKDPDLHHFKGLLKTRPQEEDEDFYFGFVNKLKSKGGKSYFWFIMFIFCQVALGLCFWFPWVFVFDRSLHGVVDWSDRRQWHRTAQLITHWMLYTCVVFCIPFMVQPTWYWALVHVFAHTFTSSFIFALNTQVGHLADDALNVDFINEQRKKRHPVAQKSWAAEQIVTSQDFGPQSHVVFFFGGGLSMQIEHHLFPGFNHCHLMKIQPIVEETCKEFNVSYKKYESWSDAWKVATEYLTSLGQH